MLVVMIEASAGEVRLTPKIKHPLVQDNGQEGGKEQMHHVFMMHMLRLLEEGGNPEQNHGTADAQIGYYKGSDGSREHNDFGYGRHQSPHDIGSQHGCVAFPMYFFHFLFVLWNFLFR